MQGPAGCMGIRIGHQQVYGWILPQGFDDTGPARGSCAGEEGGGFVVYWFNGLLVCPVLKKVDRFFYFAPTAL